MKSTKKWKNKAEGEVKKTFISIMYSIYFMLYTMSSEISSNT